MSRQQIDSATGRTTHVYAYGTSLTVTSNWGVNVKCRALCADGKVRRCSYIAPAADTFFSIRASVRIQGKTVTGFVTSAEASGEYEGERYLEFRRHTTQPNAHLLPVWGDR